MTMYDIHDLNRRRNEIMQRSVAIDYSAFEFEGIGFDYDALMRSSGYTYEDIVSIQSASMVGRTPLVELKNITDYARKFAKPGMGARILVKDEATNLSGSFKARRAAISVHKAKELGYKGVIAATSGNYGAAVAALAAKHGLKCIIVQECFDSRNVAQPEILEKARACEAYGAEVIQLSVGPELFYTFLHLLDETGYFNASLYSPYGIMGIETLGYEIAEEVNRRFSRHPDVVVCTNAGGGNLTGTARGLRRYGADTTQIYAASVNLQGLHMASDHDFNRKSFTTGHTGFGIPFTTRPDRSDVPRSAARPLRYMDKYFTVNQGSVFFITEALSVLEGMERGPAGNTSLAVAFKLAQSMEKDAIIVVQETEYSGAGKHHQPQLSFAKSNHIEVKMGNPISEVPGKNIILPSSGRLLDIQEIALDSLRRSYLKHFDLKHLKEQDLRFLQEELQVKTNHLEALIASLGGVVHERTT
ncbi:MAG: PLP-dependent lyase/thiolase [Acholeplasmatales bacterium]|nr:MAG: PLP-dependent lyase/thiolase [Acholeplasmatales bacterium]